MADKRALDQIYFDVTGGSQEKKATTIDGANVINGILNQLKLDDIYKEATLNPIHDNSVED